MELFIVPTIGYMVYQYLPDNESIFEMVALTAYENLTYIGTVTI